ncbi:MAG: cardiolipin synthase [Spirochaetia bacterium]|nr:cardiolipin synthase [Spirochaetia bacterium]
MKGLLKILSGRFLTFIILMFLQIAFLFIIILNLMERSSLYLSMIYILGFVAAFYVLSREEYPAFKMSWVIIILAAPVFGVPFYLIFGNKRNNKAIERQVNEYNQYLINEGKPYLFFSPIEMNDVSPMYKRQSDYITRLTRSIVFDGTQVTYLPSGAEAFTHIVQEIKKAKRFILIETFIIDMGYMWESILTLLKEKLKEGVDIYLLYDDLGTIQNIPKHYDSYLLSLGIKAVVFNKLRAHLNPRLNYRDHRKIIVIDGDVGFTGGLNLADEYMNRKIRFGHWKDTAVKLEGNGVYSMSEMFFQQWCFASKTSVDITQFIPKTTQKNDGYVQPFGDSPLDNYNISENAYIQIINHASRYVWITTPYLILDVQMSTALTIAAESGVDVRIITPSIPDKWYVHSVSRSHYKQLLRSGVKIYEYTPGFIHSKMFVCDDRVAIVGTTNMDYRSFYLHFECGVAMYHSSAIHDVRNDIVKTLDLCKEITLMYEQSIPFHIRFLRNILKLFSPMM